MSEPDSPRVIAARQNGAKSRGPKTPEGKARSSRNALEHGLTAEQWIVLYDEDVGAFDALLAAWEARFEPADEGEAVLVRRLAEADWRLRRATRIEFEMFTEYQHRDDDGANALGLALIRDGHGANAFGNLLRYRSGAEREFHRLYKLLSEAKAAREATRGAAEDEAAKQTEATLPDVPGINVRERSQGPCEPLATKGTREPQESAESAVVAPAAAAPAEPPPPTGAVCPEPVDTARRPPDEPSHWRPGGACSRRPVTWR